MTFSPIEVKDESHFFAGVVSFLCMRQHHSEDFINYMWQYLKNKYFRKCYAELNSIYSSLLPDI